ncbi:hypothetical protein SAMN06297468_2517 [Altererythrobacter xiamenensis]|uniref:Conjugation TrbI-like protein n=1 Tax=Altererythrobacter xiamenensis TaxID=1316679 RepID=A0A1Y6FIR7_9SPHN|nr:hypothetical protein [Altererythrobacter xiamenensis]SMQ74286.1 hypothetical protein SAMN06297468_2517 [Altererythrobacter xiamenensis]
MKSFSFCMALWVAATPTTLLAQSREAVINIGQMQSERQAEVEARAEADAKPAKVHMMPANTLVSVTPREEISSKRVEEGQRVAFVVVDDVVENGTVVIPRGSVVRANIPWKTGRAIGGKSGKFEVAFESVSLKGKSYAMTGQYRQEGRGNTVGALLGSIVISGRSAVMLPGQIVTAFTNEPIPYEVAE